MAVVPSSPPSLGGSATFGKSASSLGGGEKATPSGKRKKTYALYKFVAERVLGSGAFGIVYLAKVEETGEFVAIKKVQQNPAYKNRELHMLKECNHPNIVEMKHSFYTSGEKPGDTFLNLVMEFCAETVYRMMKDYREKGETLPEIFVRLYSYQTFRSCAYLHAIGIVHRDIKPQNLLVDARTHSLKLCDFGSAKRLLKGEESVAYITSRYYRAPELIYGSTHYTTQIDIWSAGCVTAEMFLGKAIFPGDHGVDQLVKIMKVLGSPSREDILAMAPDYLEAKFPNLVGKPWHEVLRSRASESGIDLVARLLRYNPNLRLKGLAACMHPYFDDIREPDACISATKPLPDDLFSFSSEETALMDDAMREVLIPKHVAEARKPPERDGDD